MNKKGIALILSFMVILVLTILGSAIISRSIFENNITRRYVESTQAFWLAEGGLAVVYKGLAQNWDGYTTGLPRYGVFIQNFGNGSFTVDIENGPLPDTVKVISRGTTGTAEKTLEEIINGAVGSGLPGFDFAALAAGNLFLEGSGSIQNQDVYVNGNLEVHSIDAITGGDAYAKGNATLSDGGSVTGNVNANGNITVNSGSTITGDATSKKTVNNNGTITGTTTPNATPDPVDAAALQAKVDSYRLSSQDWDNYKTEAQAEGNYHAGTFYPSGSYTGIHYVDGNLVLGSDVSGTATFVVEGNVSFESGNVSLDPALDSDYSFIIGGNLESTDTASGTLGGVIYTEGNFSVSTDITINGAILCYGNLRGSGNFNIKFPVAGATLEILSWREL
jgi:cytoskeletal protein CcmA (bactofilin family)